MKRTIIILTILVLPMWFFPINSFAIGTAVYPGPDAGGDSYVLYVYKNKLIIWGAGLPIVAEDTGVHYIIAEAQNSMEMATLNAWLALILYAKTTGGTVNIEYATEDWEGSAGIGPPRIGIIFGIAPQN